jgi:hypothetical protein
MKRVINILGGKNLIAYLIKAGNPRPAFAPCGIKQGKPSHD